MNGLKQRIIGALVLISLAVIFLPMIFDKPHQQRESQIIALPVKPDVPVISFQSPAEPSYSVLDDQGVEMSDESAFPDEPMLGSKPVIAEIEENKPPVVVEKAISTVKDSKATEHKVTNLKPKPRRDASPTVANMAMFKSSYMVQLGTFSLKKNAISLRSKLINMKLDGHVAIYDADGKTMWRVFAGPYVNEKKAVAVKKRLDKAFKVTSIIRHF